MKVRDGESGTRCVLQGSKLVKPAKCSLFSVDSILVIRCVFDGNAKLNL